MRHVWDHNSPLECLKCQHLRNKRYKESSVHLPSFGLIQVVDTDTSDTGYESSLFGVWGLGFGWKSCRERVEANDSAIAALAYAVTAPQPRWRT